MKRLIQRRGFTVIEMLVAMLVLVILVILVSQLMSSARSITAFSDRHMDADSQARAVLDRMELDFNGMIERGDVDYYFQKQNGSDQMAFFSQASGYFPSSVAANGLQQSPLALVGYRIIDNQFQRLGKGLVWSGLATGTDSPLVFLPNKITAVWPDIAGNGNDPDYQVIGDQIYRLEFYFMLKDGTYSDHPWVAAHTGINGMKDVAAIVVTIAVLDGESQKLVPDMGLAALALPDPVFTSGTDPNLAAVWNDVVNRGGGIPVRASSSQIRIYQRYFYLNQTPSDD